MMRNAHLDMDVAFRCDAVGTRIGQLYAESGLCARDFCATFGYTRKALFYWSRGVSVPNADAIYTICRTFGVSADWLLGLSERRKPGEAVA